VIQDVEMVVKELLENALDAGAKKIKCVIEDAGSRVLMQDDGPGISPADMECIGVSHSTSKLASLDDLKHLSTYGFRGEGLHAIASQGVLRVRSRLHGASNGWGKAISYASGAEVSEPLAVISDLENGTTVVVENLFGALPVRRQVMAERQDASHRALMHMFTCYALAHSDVSFRLEMSSKPPLVVQASPSLELRCSDLYGPDMLKQMEHVRWISEEVDELWEFECLLPKPGLSNYDHVVRSKPRSFVLVNKRPVKLDPMMKLINRCFRAHVGLGPRKYPMVLLSLTLPPDTYDINLSVEKSKINLMNEDHLVQFLTRKIEDFYPAISSQQSGR
jgi:DNA mismatch repair protein MutL